MKPSNFYVKYIYFLILCPLQLWVPALL